jgi:hypothetical protein
MKKNKTIYFILLLIGAIEIGRGIQMIFTGQFWNLNYPYARLSVLLQFIIGGVVLFIAHILKPTED